MSCLPAMVTSKFPQCGTNKGLKSNLNYRSPAWELQMIASDTEIIICASVNLLISATNHTLISHLNNHLSGLTDRSDVTMAEKGGPKCRTQQTGWKFYSR